MQICMERQVKLHVRYLVGPCALVIVIRSFYIEFGLCNKPSTAETMHIIFCVLVNWVYDECHILITIWVKPHYFHELNTISLVLTK